MTSMEKRILIVDDDEKLLKLLKEFLESYAFNVLTSIDGSDVMNTIRKESPDMVILDIMLPYKNGLDVLREIRGLFTVPVIMLTAKGEDTDRIIGLELGADDYLPKPFNPRELLARMNAVWRRLTPEEKVGGKRDENGAINAGGLRLSRARQAVSLEGKDISLSSTEYKILEVLMVRPNRVLSRDQIMNLARGRDFMAFDRSIDVHISKLRAKLESNPRSPERIKTIWGTGYMFVDE